MNRYRIYYNRSEDMPWVWSFDEGTQATERLLTGYRLHGVDVCDGQDMNAPRVSKETPRVWLSVEAKMMRIDADGVGHFFGRWVDSGFPLAEPA